MAVVTYIDSAFDGIIDQVSTGLTFSFVGKQLPSTSFYVLASNKTTYITTSYSFSITFIDPIPANGYLILTFPMGITLTSPSITSASFSTSTCTINQTNNGINLSNNLTLNNCFPSGLTSLSVSLSIGGITNPSSLAPSDSFQVFTFGSIGLVDYLMSGPSVTMTNLAQSTSFSLTPTSTLVHDTTTYTFVISFYGNHDAN